MSTHYQLNKNVKFKNLMIKKVMKYYASTYGWKIPMENLHTHTESGSLELDHYPLYNMNTNLTRFSWYSYI